ncbi:MAG: hypothetical protein BWX72_01275 [Firmicutes bacterium ADurb.Bin080]|nr:thioether cross-link-forming SCIFF peptide maturase [Clostridiales bacterium]OQC14575.1 MAG: hypothetical protein BWX72_01275 [Firmicutes bacterium ADurb.Bin080]
MVHAFSYKHKNKDLFFLWDVESGSLHYIDEAAFLLYKKLYDVPMDVEEIDKCDRISDFSKNEIVKEFEELIRNNLLFTKPYITSFNKSLSHIKALCLHICHDCNLSCKYCFAKDGTYNTEKDYMSFSVGKAAIDFLIGNSGNIKNLEVDFFGGEPLLNFDVVKQIVEYAKGRAEQVSKKIDFTLTTNCINLSEDIREFLNREMVNVVLSIDGRKETHDKVRCTRSGVSVYDHILNNALSFVNIRGEKKYYVRGTYTSENLFFSKDVLFLNDAGFSQISFEPVVLPEENDLCIKTEDISCIKNEYHNLAEEYLERRKTKKWFNFFHYMIDLEKGPCINKRLTGCGAGVEYLAVSPTGEIYPCHQFVGKPEYYLGNVFIGELDLDIRTIFSKNTIFSKPHCSNCFAKYYCGGGCVANSVNFSGNIDGHYEIGCELSRIRLENSLAIWAIEKYDL